MSRFSPKQRIGTWVVLHPLHVGSTIFYSCQHSQLPDSRAVLKIYPIAEDGASKNLFQQEVDALRLLNHPIIPRLTDYGTDIEAGVYWVALEWFEGVSLADILVEGPMEWRLACTIFHQIAAALRHMHGSGISHRNLNPNHILLETEQNAYLINYDHALNETSENMLSTGRKIDLGYSAPEAIRGESEGGARADLYALGIVFYEALTGHAAFPPALWGGEKGRLHARTILLELSTRTEPLDPGEVCPDWLRSLVRKATHPDPAERLPDVDSFVSWLDAAQTLWTLPSDLPTETYDLKPMGLDLAPSISKPRAATPTPPAPAVLVDEHGIEDLPPEDIEPLPADDLDVLPPEDIEPLPADALETLPSGGIEPLPPLPEKTEKTNLQPPQVGESPASGAVEPFQESAQTLNNRQIAQALIAAFSAVFLGSIMGAMAAGVVIAAIMLLG